MKINFALYVSLTMAVVVSSVRLTEDSQCCLELSETELAQIAEVAELQDMA